MIAHFPLLEVKVKPDPDGVAVNVAQVPVVYHVPLLIIQPSALPPVVTGRVPFPENGVPGTVVGVVVEEVLVFEEVLVVVVVPPLVPLGRYFTPVAGQLDFEPSGLVGMKSPVWTEPLTS